MLAKLDKDSTTQPLSLRFPPMTIIRQIGLYIIITSSLCLSPVSEAWSKPKDITAMLGCRACHRLNGQGGQIGPNLQGIGQRLSRRELEQLLTSQDAADSERRMPRYDYLFESERKLLLDILEQQ